MIQNKIFKSLSSVIITVVVFIGLSCDDRVVTELDKGLESDENIKKSDVTK